VNDVNKLVVGLCINSSNIVVVGVIYGGTQSSTVTGTT